MASGEIVIKGARVNNLKNVDIAIPRGKLVVITGISGSGKSSLAFDTLFAEGQRRYAESLSSYARQFLGRMSKPDVDSIEGVPPAIAIEQKVSTRNPRSTVGTTTEVYDYLRLLFARIGRTFSPVSGNEVRRDSVSDVLNHITSNKGVFYLLADPRWKDRDDRTEMLLDFKQSGYNRLWINGKAVKVDEVFKSGEVPADALLLIDRVASDGSGALDDRVRVMSSVNDAFKLGDGSMSLYEEGSQSMRTFCTRFELDGMVFAEPEENLFSFNSPAGACPYCGGLGKTIGISEDLVVPDKSKSIYDGAIACWRGEKMSWFKDHLVSVASKFEIDIFKPWCELSQREKDLIWNGDGSPDGSDENGRIISVREFFAWVDTQKYKIQYKYMLSRFSGKAVCPECHGTRLRKEALWVKAGGRNIAELLDMNVCQLTAFLENLKLGESEKAIAREPLSETLSRLHALKDVGLGYLSLSRACNTLSGGESQRVNLVAALGGSLVGSMYILDEPSIGLHPRDTERLIAVMKRLRDLGNTVIVVEHDEEIIQAADYLVDMGPMAGAYGGEVVFAGVPSSNEKSLTLKYINGEIQRYRRSIRDWNYSITVKGAREHNLQNIDVRVPLGVLTVVTGVSGSGKSSLVGDILYPALYRRINESGDLPGTFSGLEGNLDRINRVEYVDQNPIGRSSRSNAVTYLKAYGDICKLLSDQQYARINGFTPSYFSFNSDGGRCPECQGDGYVKIEMQFMADVTMVCEECGGKRFKPEVLEVRYRGKNIDDILNMSVDQAIAFFSEGPEPEAAEVVRKLRPLSDVGLGYIGLGQGSSTLSGGESQRVKLASFLSSGTSKAGRERVLFIFDEPTTGLHFYDVEKLLRSFDMLLDAGHSILVVEHNPDVIRNADWVIDLGPDAGDEGGRIVFEGKAEDLKKTTTFTAKYI